MKFIADLHIHSHYSIATSRQLNPEYLDKWARIKGIRVVGTGDMSHPGWLDELKSKLVPAGDLYELKPGLRIQDDLTPEVSDENSVYFILTAEISTIYKRDGNVRKVHHVIFLPGFKEAELFQQKLDRIGNIRSDGRPILGLDSRDLLEIVLETSENAFFVPAHIWTPWFSVLGDKSGFDSIESCYGPLSGNIFAVETGLSSDPPMNRQCSFLDRYTLISNSDAHSPEKLGREANLFDTELSYQAMLSALKDPGPGRFQGTVEFFPQEGKYHVDGHRKCGIRMEPEETKKHRGLCPKCGKPVTVGVLNRVMQLADRAAGEKRTNWPPFYSLIPLKELLSEIHRVGPNSKRISKEYNELIRKAGSEFNLLLHLPVEEVCHVGGEQLAEGIRRMRTGEVSIQSGYDGEFGRIRVFKENEIV